MKLKITHIGPRPYQVREANLGLVELSGGETYEGEFTDGDAAAIAANTQMFTVEGYVPPTPSPSAPGAKVADAIEHLRKFKDSVTPIAHRLGIHDSAAFNDTVIAKLDAGDEAEKSLVDIAALFGPDVKPEQAFGKVKDALASLAGGSTGEAKLNLADAVKSLDDTKAEHWTDGGKPDLGVLATLTGATVKRADVDAIGRVRKVS